MTIEHNNDFLEIMKTKILLLSLATVCLVSMQSCRRNYKVNYARVPVDTLQHNYVDSLDEEEVEEEEFDIYEIPKNVTPSELMDRENRRAAKEAERIFSGEE